MQLKFVELFCDVVARRSFSKAAAAHGVSQSAASQAVGTLEKQLGVRLLDRSQRPLELTPAGQVYVDGCRKLLEEFRLLEDKVRRAQGLVKGVVRVAAIYSINLMQMDSLEHRFQELFPEAQLKVDYVHPDEVYERLLSDEADLGLVSFPRSGGEFACIDWQAQPMVVVVPPGHALAAAGKASLAMLEGEDFVGFTEELTIRREVDRCLRRARVDISVIHVFDNIESIKSAIEIGQGVSILPEPTVRQEVQAGTLVSLPLVGERIVRPLGIVHRRHRPLSTPAQKLVEMLRQSAQDEPSGVPGKRPRIISAKRRTGKKRQAAKVR